MILTWVVIMPIDAAGSKGTDTGIEAFTFGNVGLSETPRYAAHLIVAWILTCKLPSSSWAVALHFSELTV